jgi:hypothetical protein
MREATNKQEPSGAEGGEVKVGDKVWVKAIVEFVEPGSVRIAGLCGGGFWTVASDCRPVESANFSEISDGSSDPINPSHYKHLPAEAIDIIEAAIAKAPSNQFAFLQGQVIKYLLRCWSKKGIEDLRKAKWYLDRLVGGFDDLLAEASGANDGPKRKRYRTPTLADLANGPIACECIGTQLDKWQPQILLEILNEAGYPYRASCPKNQHKITRWSQCRIEVGE